MNVWYQKVLINKRFYLVIIYNTLLVVQIENPWLVYFLRFAA